MCGRAFIYVTIFGFAIQRRDRPPRYYASSRLGDGDNVRFWRIIHNSDEVDLSGRVMKIHSWPKEKK